MMNGKTRKGVLEAVKDPLYRLTRADRTNPGATPPNQWTWNYDAVGNRTSAQKDQEATTSTHNEKNQLLQTSGGGKMLWRGVLDEPGTATFNAASASINGQPARMLAGNVFEATLDLPAGANTVTIQAQDGSGNVSSKSYSVNVLGVPATYTYDANGNLATKTEGADAWVYTWNALNQLTGVTKNSAAVAIYQYDPMGRRVERVVGVARTSWTYDDADIVRQVETAGSVATPLHLLHGLETDESLAQESESGVSYLHADGLNSVTRHSNSSGVVIDQFAYDPWGNLQMGTPALYGFHGREWDSATQLWSTRARYYSPQSGRFISEDPIGSVGSGTNWYEFVKSRPTNAVDPTGLEISSPPSWQATPRGPFSLLGCVEGAFRDEFGKAEADKAYGWRYAHCMSACRVRKCGVARKFVDVLGFFNEVYQLAECKLAGADCHSAFAPIDLVLDNPTGYSCPTHVSCAAQCSTQKGQNKREADYGPFYDPRKKGK